MRCTAFKVNCCGLRIPLTCPVTLQRTSGDPHTHAHMAEQPISLDGADGVSPGAPNAHAEGGDPVGDVVGYLPADHLGECTRPRNGALPREASAEAQQAAHIPQPAVDMVYLEDPLRGIAVCKLWEANGDFADSEVRFWSPTRFRQHLDTERKGHREALK